MYFLLGESDVLITIPDDVVSYMSKGMDTEATKMPHEPKQDSKDDTDLSCYEFGKELEVKVPTSSGFTSFPLRESVDAGAPLHLRRILASFSQSGILLMSLYLRIIHLHMS